MEGRIVYIYAIEFPGICQQSGGFISLPGNFRLNMSIDAEMGP